MIFRYFCDQATKDGSLNNKNGCTYKALIIIRI